jgi:hypothetical protein
MYAASHVGSTVPLKRKRDETQPYQYTALDHSKSQVRLVKFGKSKDRGFSQPWCDISTFDLDSAPPYHALSYTWGSQSPAYTILVNDGYKCIGNNLFKFCQEIFRNGFSISGSSTDTGKAYDGDEDKAIYFWIDQLCINQADYLERNHQVNLMGMIYSEALMTVIWFHDEGQLKSPWKLECRKAVELPFTHAFILTTYKRIILHTYFSRLWVIQEILLARKVHIMIEGGVRVSWDDLSKCSLSSHITWSWKASDDSPAGFPNKPGGITILPELSRARRVWKRDSSHDPRGIFVPYCMNECSDPKDKVFGLMGLVGKKFRIDVDYKKSIYHILFDILRMVSRLPVERPSNYSDIYERDSRCKVLAVVGSQIGLTHIQHNGWLISIKAYLKDSAPDYGMEICDEVLAPRSRVQCNTNTAQSVASPGFETKSSSTLKFNGHRYVEYWWYEIKGMRNIFPCLPLNQNYPAPTTFHTHPDDSKRLISNIELCLWEMSPTRNWKETFKVVEFSSVAASRTSHETPK